MTELCKGTKIDEATQQIIYDWYQYRKVCDNELFPTFFNRTLKLYQRQYLQLLRLETAEIDPMISDYMERYVERVGSEHTDSDSNATRTDDLRNDSQNRGQILTINEHENNGNKDGTNNTDNKDTTINKYGAIVDNTTHNDTKTDAKGLTGATPDSSMYPVAGFPESLKWQYASNQSEQKTDATSDTKTKTNNSGQDEKDTIGGTDVTYHDEFNDSGHETITSTDSRGTLVTNTGTVTNKNITKTDGHTKDVHKEIYAGRHEAPQDMLDRAYTYFMRSNAFIFLMQKLDKCFMAVYDI